MSISNSEYLPKEQQGTGTAFFQSALERKLELLESRFSQPLSLQQSPTTAASEATLQPLSSPNNHSNNGTQQSNSFHSFAFASPTSATTLTTTHCNFNKGISATQQTRYNSPKQESQDNNTFVLRTRSKRSPSPCQNTSKTTLEHVRKAADRQMRKVAAAQRFTVASSSCSEVSSESNRLVRNASNDDQPPPPPPLAATPPQPVSDPTASKKRKSIPVKIEEPSVKENLKNSENNNSRNRTATSRNTTQKKATTNKPQDSFPKTTSKPTDPAQKKIADKEEKTSPLLDAAETSCQSANRVSPRPSTASRETENVSKKETKVLQNNSTITDFFQNMPSKRRKVGNKNEKSSQRDPQTSTTLNHTLTTTVQIQPNKANLIKTDELGETGDLKKRLEELEQTCRDQQEQLRAVTNNRTILHTALQAALTQREQELNQIKELKASWEERSRNVLEDFVRSEATRTARQVRERLAADGARLGRIVYNRVGIRSAPVETWEEGHAVRNLTTRMQQLRLKRKQLEQRFQLAQKHAQPWLTTKSTTTINTDQKQAQEGDTQGDAQGDTQDMKSLGLGPISSKMDAMEAVESVRYHLENMRRKERELMEEEQTLNDEKAAHVRALKRVASEDASRFRSFPKLNNRYVLKCLLGKGGFSEVWRAFDLAEVCEVAVKIHQLDPRWSEAKKENYTKHVSREYEIHRNVRHPRIVSLYDVFEIDNNSFATVLEICEGTDLEALLKEKRRLPERDARAILLQILSGMQYLSQPSPDGDRQGIIHYDLKPGNILFDEYGDAKITDFGLSKIVETDPNESMELTSQGAGTYWYLPPECFVTDETVRISNKVDVWSIGIIFYQMLTGRRPFGDTQSPDGLLNNRTMLNARQVVFPEKPKLSEECKAFIRKCLTYDQAFRPSMAQLCQQPYVTTSTETIPSPSSSSPSL